MNHPLQAALSKLRQSEQGALASSNFTPSQRKALEDFGRQTNAIVAKPRGRGVIYCITQPKVVEQHWQQLTPFEASTLDKNLPARATNIANNRNSKSAQHQHDNHYLLLKAKGSVKWSSRNGHILNLQEATDQMGAASIKISATAKEDAGWQSEQPLWLVENQALFDRLDWLPEQQTCSVIYYSGQLRNLLINWLAQQKRANGIYFFPDYDGVGLLNYARLKNQLGEQVKFWLMPNWKKLLKQTGSNALWQKTDRDFNAALPQLKRLCSNEPELINLIEAMQSSGLALEQEAVWLNENS